MTGLHEVTFETKCYEKDWMYVLNPERLKKVIKLSNYNFKERIVYINNVNNLDEVRDYADIALFDGIITRYVVVDEYAKEALNFFDINKDSFNGGYYYSIQELVGIYLCKTDYLLHFSSDSYPEEPYNWIDTAIGKMNLQLDIKVANLTWNRRFEEAKDAAIDEDENFYTGSGFSDQNYLIRVEDFRNRIYNEKPLEYKWYPEYGGELFEKRVDSWMRNNNYKRITYKHGSYLHINF